MALTLRVRALNEEEREALERMARSRTTLGAGLVRRAQIVLQIASHINFSDRWTATHWLFNYDLGFIKRGFVGTATKIVFGELAFTEELPIHDRQAGVMTMAR